VSRPNAIGPGDRESPTTRITTNADAHISTTATVAADTVQERLGRDVVGGGTSATSSEAMTPWSDWPKQQHKRVFIADSSV
jgi:hypothetical protein